MKTNIKMRVTPEQSTKIQEICFNNGVEWNIALNKISHIDKPYLAIEPTKIFYKSTEVDYSRIPSLFQEIDADLFIRTNGTCEENQLKDFIQSQNENIDRVNDWTKEFNDVSLKLKKKNEILKKARIKRKNQREELHKLNLKLQKCISLEEHNQIMQKYKLDLFISESKLLSTESHNEKLNEATRNINDSLGKLIDIKYNQAKEIEKLKAVIEYLESKVK